MHRRNLDVCWKSRTQSSGNTGLLVEDYHELCCSFRCVRVFVRFSVREAWLQKPLTVGVASEQSLMLITRHFGWRLVKLKQTALSQHARGPRADHLMYIAHENRFSKRKAAMWLAGFCYFQERSSKGFISLPGDAVVFPKRVPEEARLPKFGWILERKSSVWAASKLQLCPWTHKNTKKMKPQKTDGRPL